MLEEHPDVDLVITDVMMPNVGGLEMLERIRQRPEWKTLPVVVATSLANQATVRQAVSLHCKHFIVKPFTVQLLLQTVREAIGQRGVVLQDKTRVARPPRPRRRRATTSSRVTFATFVHERVGGAPRALRARASAEPSSTSPCAATCSRSRRAPRSSAPSGSPICSRASGCRTARCRPRRSAAPTRRSSPSCSSWRGALPQPPKKRERLVDDNPLDGRRTATTATRTAAPRRATTGVVARRALLVALRRGGRRRGSPRMLATVVTCALVGIDAHPVQVEVDLATGIPHTQTVGLPDSSVRESKDRVRSALRNAGFEIPPRRITVNLAPAHLRKEGAAYDLPIALALLAATGTSAAGSPRRRRRRRRARARRHACGRSAARSPSPPRRARPGARASSCRAPTPPRRRSSRTSTVIPTSAPRARRSRS